MFYKHENMFQDITAKQIIIFPKSKGARNLCSHWIIEYIIHKTNKTTF
jgi:hypothetical protein